jgi:hypothetical protein
MKSNNNPMVKVRIQAQETVEYDQEVMMLQSDFDRFYTDLNSAKGRQLKKLEEKIVDSYIDHKDVLDADEKTVTSFELSVAQDQKEA